MTAPWTPTQLFADARHANRALVWLPPDTAPVIAAMCDQSGYDHAFLVAHVGPTTRPQPIVMPVRLTAAEPSH